MAGCSRREYLGATAAMLGGLLAAACGGVDIRRGDGGNTGVGDRRGAAKSYQGVTIRFAAKATGEADLKLNQRLIREFEQEFPGATVSVEFKPGEGYFKTLQTHIAAGTPPDMARQDEYYIPHFAVKGLLLPLGPLAKQDKKFDAKGIYPAAYQAGHYRGTLYALPSNLFGPVLIYNRAAYQELGLKPPPKSYKAIGDWTWRRLREDAQKLTQRGANQQVERAGFAFDAGFLSRFSGQIRSNGGRLVDRLDDPQKLTLNEPKDLELVQLFSDMRNVDRTAAPAEWYNGWPQQASTLFLQGKIAIMVTLHSLNSYRKAEFAWDYAPLPRRDTATKPDGFAGANVYTVFKATKYPELAWAWTRMIGGPKFAQWQVEDPAITMPPPWQTVYDAFLKLRPPETVNVLVEIGEYAQRSVMTTVYDELQKEVLDGLMPVWNGQVAARAGVEEMVRKADALFEKAQR